MALVAGTQGSPGRRGCGAVVGAHQRILGGLGL